MFIVVATGSSPSRLSCHNWRGLSIIANRAPASSLALGLCLFLVFTEELVEELLPVHEFAAVRLLDANGDIPLELSETPFPGLVALVQEPKGFSNDLAGRAIRPALNLLVYESLKFRGQRDVHNRLAPLRFRLTRAAGFVNYLAL